MGLSDLFIDAKDLPEGGYGFCQLLFLLAAYGYILFQASNLISDGSELLLLVPSLAGLVGSCVLPVLGAVPDGAIVLFSGMGPDAQEQLSVGVGALAGSTIMLLTVPWFLSVYAGSVDIEDGECVYRKPKVSGMKAVFWDMGVQPTADVRYGAQIMMLTSLSYLLIQVPAGYLHGPEEEIAKGEKKWALAAMLVCIIAFVSYLVYQYIAAQKADEDSSLNLKVDAVVVERIQKGEISLLGALNSVIHLAAPETASEATPLKDETPLEKRLKAILKPFFHKYDTDHNASLERSELGVVMSDLGMHVSADDLNKRFERYDIDSDGSVSFHEFVQGTADMLREEDVQTFIKANSRGEGEAANGVATAEEDEEEEEMPEEFVSLPPDVQQRRILMRAFYMMGLGTGLVLVFSDPMVDVLSELGNRINVTPFYVSFVLAPLASNASELLASYNYALKKTSKSITISLTALEGAGSMNNTFCLGIFMVLIYTQGLAWEFTAETIAILFAQFAVGLIALAPVQRVWHAAVVLAIYPVSLILVSALEAIGFD
uniref:EF-hand domain-containing protein n=1 Tax=Phaeomonas parva TaxID=124430 RepID=A0A6U4FF05_9STRA